MSIKTLFFGLFSTLSLSFLVFPAVTNASQYYLQYPGNSFQPRWPNATYYKSVNSYMYHNDLDDDYYFCPVNFNVADGATHFIKSIGIRYFDNLTDGYIYIVLKRHNLYTGAHHDVASWWSGDSAASPSDQTASQGTNTGFKLIDTKKFVYYLYVFFYRNDSINPSTDLKLYQVRVHYGS